MNSIIIRYKVTIKFTYFNIDFVKPCYIFFKKSMLNMKALKKFINEKLEKKIKILIVLQFKQTQYYLLYITMTVKNSAVNITE